MEDKIKLSNKIYPYFYGISGDLLFFVSIDTLFLGVIKGYSGAQINFLTTFALLFILILQPLNMKLINKLGNINSIKFGMWILLIGAILITFSNNYLMTLLGFVLYEVAYIFKSMENVVLKRNLLYLNTPDEYINIQSRGVTIYAVAALIISLIAGYFFRVNSYLPMYLCITCCVINIILAHFLYEADIKDNTAKNNIKLKLTKVVLLIMICYCTGYAAMSLAQSNSKLFIQTNALRLLDVEKTSMYLVTIIAVSRTFRAISNMIFPKIYKILKDKILYLSIVLCVSANLFVIIGNAVSNNMIGVYIMSIGYIIYLGIKDPYQTYIKDLFLNNTEKGNQEEAIALLTMSKNVQRLLISAVITLMLLKYNLTTVFIMLLGLSIVELLISLKLYKIIGGKNG